MNVRAILVLYYLIGVKNYALLIARLPFNEPKSVYMDPKTISDRVLASITILRDFHLLYSLLNINFIDFLVTDMTFI